MRAVGAAAVLGFAAALRMEGLIDTDVLGPVADDVVAVLGEALTNGPAGAGGAGGGRDRPGDGVLAVTVSDDGVGVTEGGGRSGLRNLAEATKPAGADCPSHRARTVVEPVWTGGSRSDLPGEFGP
ncbi:hypothetical protein ACFQ9Q_02390 [Streptomyces virginiae]|uniref:hypothetical protein n=1 Tax=Streptomyces virginiae TaxID=1961 RepID=UPI0036A20782